MSLRADAQNVLHFENQKNLVTDRYKVILQSQFKVTAAIISIDHA